MFGSDIMAYKGLSRETVVRAAAGLIEEAGKSGFSMRLLAEKLGVKTASLYNHVESMDSLMADVCLYAVKQQETAEMLEVKEKHGEDAVRTLADTYRAFAKEHAELYWLIMDMAARNDRLLYDIAVSLSDPVRSVLRDFRLPEVEVINYLRFFRGIVHGFVSQEKEGFFSHDPTPVDDSFHFAVDRFIDSLKTAESRCAL